MYLERKRNFNRETTLKTMDYILLSLSKFVPEPRHLIRYLSKATCVAWNIISVHKRRAAGSLWRIPWSNKTDNTRKIRRGNHHPGAEDAAADNNLVVNIS